MTIDDILEYLKKECKNLQDELDPAGVDRNISTISQMYFIRKLMFYIVTGKEFVSDT